MSLAVTKLIELVHPQRTNHHGTLYGGTALALMDKTAFLTVSRYARRNFVTAGTQEINFLAPAQKGEIIELIGGVERVGKTSITANVELYAEELLSGKRKLCARGNIVFATVDSKDPIQEAAASDEPLPPHAAHMMEMIFPGETNHRGMFYGGGALALMGKAAFVAATRFCRQTMVTKAAERTDFYAAAQEGELVDLVAEPVKIDGSDVTITVTMHAENLLTGARRLCARGQFIMQARDANGQPLAIARQL